MKKFFNTVPKVLFAIICYLCAIILAFLSGYFTVIFYSQSQTGLNMWAMGGLAAMLEFIKFMLATSYPFLQYRDNKRERKVLFYLKICLILSIMASLNFFLTGGEIERSPASNITILLYEYIPVLGIIPLKFSQFITTMSLSILIEVFIIFLPILAPIMFLEKDYSRKKKYDANTNFEKIKEIVTVIPERLIDSLHKKVVGIENNLQIEGPKEDIKVVEMNEKFKLKLLKNKNVYNADYDKYTDGSNTLSIDYDKDTKEIDSRFVKGKDKSKESSYKNDSKVDDNGKFARDKIVINSQDENLQNWYKENENKIDIVMTAIENNRNENKAPSNAQLIKLTDFVQNDIVYSKKILREEGKLKTEGFNVYITKYLKEVKEEC